MNTIMNVNVKIPLSLLNQIIYVLDNINIVSYDDSFQTEYFNLLNALNRKKDSLRLREDYANVIHAKDEDSRDLARLRYLQHKRIFSEVF